MSLTFNVLYLCTIRNCILTLSAANIWQSNCGKYNIKSRFQQVCLSFLLSCCQFVYICMWICTQIYKLIEIQHHSRNVHVECMMNSIYAYRIANTSDWTLYKIPHMTDFLHSILISSNFELLRMLKSKWTNLSKKLYFLHRTN